MWSARLIKPIFLLPFFVAFFQAPAQQHNFISYGVEDGLPQSQVFSISQDHQGYLWIGTAAGPVKFDGLQFSPLFYNFSKGTYSILEDRKKNLWFATERGLFLYNGKTLHEFKIKGIENEFITAVCNGAGDDVWVGTYGKGLYHYQNGKFTKLENTNEATSYVYRMVYGGSNKLWIATSIGLGLFDGKKFRKYGETDGLPEFRVFKVYEDKKLGLLVSIQDKGVYVYNKATDKFSRLPMPQEINNSLIVDIYRDTKQNMWFCTYDNGVYKVPPDNNVVHYTTENGLNDNFVFCCFEDREGIMWFGSNGVGGLSKYYSDRFLHYSYKANFGSSVVSAIKMDKNGRLYFSTRSEVYYFDDGTKQFMPLNIPKSSGVAEINQLYVDDENNLLISTLDEGPVVYNGKKFTSYSKKYDFGYGTATIIKDSKGVIWLGNAGALSVLNKGKLEIKHHKLLDSKFITAIVEDTNDLYWIATDAGLLQYKLGEFSNAGEDDTLANTYVPSMAKDKFGNMWFATYGGGLYCYTKNGYRHYTDHDKLSSNTLSALCIEDETIYLGTLRGFDRLRINKDGEIIASQNYGKHEGFTGSEVYDNAICSDKKGNIWFATSKGITIFNSKEDFLNTNLPQPRITAINLFNEKTEWSKYGLVVDSLSNLPIEPELRYNMNHLTFEFVGLSNTVPEKIKYSYKLEGFDKDWSAPTSVRYVSYSNLNPGVYTFMVKARNSDGLWNGQPATYHFLILAPIWQRWWFMAICIGVVILVVYYLVYKKINGIRAKEENKREFMRQLTEYKLIALKAQMNPHFVFNALNTVQYFISKDNKEEAYNAISKFSKLMRMVLEKSGEHYISLKDELQLLHYYIEIELLRFQQSISYHIDVDTELRTENVRISSFLIQPYVENALIHGLMNKEDAGKINVRVKKIDDKILMCTIEDNGVGRQKAQELKTKKDVQYKSFGMSITQNRLDLINGDQNQLNVIDIVDASGKPAGTRVEITIPYTKILNLN